MRSTRWFLVIALLGGCAFDARVPPDAKVSCDVNTPCPSGFFCQLTLGRCVSSENPDKQAPGVISATFSRSLLMRGAALELVLVVSEPLGVAPRVAIAQASRSTPMELVEIVEAEQPRYRFAYTVGSDDVEGPASVFADLLDRVGNESNAVPLGTVTLDFTAPAPTSLSYVAPRASDGGTLKLRLDEEVQVRLTMSEPVAAGSRLTAVSTDCDAGQVDYVLTSNQAGLLDFTVSAPAGEPSCSYALHLGGVTDLAGNAQSPEDLVVGAPYRVEDSPPAITGLATYRALDGGWSPAAIFSRQPGFSEVGIRFELGASAVVMTASLDGQPIAGCDLSACPVATGGDRQCSCLRAMQPGDTEGAHAVLVSARDVAGNVRVVSVPVSFDFTPPALGSSNVSLQAPSGCPLGAVGAAGVGATASESFTVTELLASDPIVTAAKGAWSIAKNAASSSGLFFQYQLTLSAADASGQGSFSPQVVLTDLVGNASAPLSLPAIANDTVPPTPPAVDTLDAVVYQRVPWGFDEARTGSFSPRTFRVIGASAAVDGDTTRVLAYDGPNPATSAEVGSVATVSGGAWTMELNRADRTEVFVASFDRACNSSSVVRVRDVSWTATMGYKVPGSTIENPLVWSTTSARANTLAQDPAASAEPGVAQLASLTAVDSQAVIRAAEASWRLLGGPNVPGRGSLGLAYDSARGTVVVFGGRGASGLLQDTWEWDGTTRTWRNRTPAANSPPARWDFAMVYDSLRGKVVLFGGNNFNLSPMDDLWEWDGVSGTWSQRTQAGDRPPALSHHAMAYDSARGRVVLFAGGSTWEWNGAAGTWSLRTTTGPSARSDTAMAYDTARRTVVLFGGSSLQDTWEWDGAAGTWSSRAPAQRPPGRRGHQMAYDRARGKVVMFGGSGTTNVDLQDTWEWDGASGTWSVRTPSSNNPPARAFHGMAYDTARGVTLIFGGSPSLQDTWEWSGLTGTWLERTPSQISPTARDGHAMAYDSARKRVVLFGGGASLQDTWEWDVARGVWLNRTPSANNPPGRREHAMAYDSSRGRVVMFGGLNGSIINPPFNDTWEWDGATGTWTDRAPVAPVPTQRVRHAMAYDEARGRVVMFGGSASFVWQQDLWEWDGASGTWTNRTPASNNPAVRFGHALAYDGARGKVVLFGGFGATTFQDTWEWDGASATWADRTPGAPNPSARNGHALAYDVERRKVVLCCGTSRQDTWEWDGASGSWADRSPVANNPASRNDSALAYAGNGRLLLFGGAINFGDTWEWNGGAAGAPGQMLQLPLSAMGATSTATVRSLAAAFWAGGTGYPAGVATHGAELLLWSEGAWQVLATNVDPAAAPQLLQWSTSDPAVMGPLLLAPTLAFAMKPSAPNGTGVGQVAVDYAEVTVRYRLP